MSEEKSRYWEERYQSGTPGWDRGGVSPALLQWLDAGVLTPCRILIPGCGHGHEVVALAQRGFSVSAVDIAPTPLARLQERLQEAGLDAHLIQADVLDWQPEAPFDAIYEQTCLCALAPQDWPRYAAQLHRWLRPGGLLFALFMQTGRPGGPPYHCELGEMRSLFPLERWAWVDEPHREVPHPTGLFEYAAVLQRLG
jgi:SAM-dependent methyltransferase